MSPKKRGSNGGDAEKAKKPKGAAANDGGLEQAAQAAISAYGDLPWWNAAMNLLDEILMSGCGASDWLCRRYPGLEQRTAFAEQVRETFPLPADTHLSWDFSPGLKTFQIWQVCYHVQAGHKGMIPNEFFKPLVMLILLEGCKTDASCLAGVEYPVLAPLVPSYFDTLWTTATIMSNTYDCQSVGFVKGWSRGLAMVTAAHIMIELDLWDYYRQHMPQQFKSYCVLKGMVPERMGTQVEQISANRGYLEELVHSHW